MTSAIRNLFENRLLDKILFSSIEREREKKTKSKCLLLSCGRSFPLLSLLYILLEKRMSIIEDVQEEK